jgi:hypothetical protein
VVNDPLTDARTLNIGDVVTVAVKMKDDSWWRRFACVLEKPTTRWYVMLLTLKQVVDIGKDIREVSLSEDIVTFLPEAEWPQGVVAMRMKYLAKGVIQLPPDD